MVKQRFTWCLLKSSRYPLGKHPPGNLRYQKSCSLKEERTGPPLKRIDVGINFFQGTIELCHRASPLRVGSWEWWWILLYNHDWLAKLAVSSNGNLRNAHQTFKVNWPKSFFIIKSAADAVMPERWEHNYKTKAAYEAIANLDRKVL